MNELQAQMNDLTSYIQESGGYQTVPLDPSVADLGNRELSEALAPVSDESIRRLTPEALDGTSIGDALSGAGGNVGESAGTGQQGQGVTTQTPGEPVVDVAQLQQEFAAVQQREQEALQQARNYAALAAKRENEAFIAQLNATVADPAERQARYAQFQLRQAQVRNAALNAEVQGIKAQKNQEAERLARVQVIQDTAREFGITDQEHMAFLYDAQSPEHLRQIAARVQRFARTSQTAQTQVQREQRLNEGVDVAGGASAGFTPPKAPKERSGDLIGLIRSRGHSVLPMIVEPGR